MKDWFKNWFDSPYYELLYQDRDMNEARNFIELLSQNFGIHENYKILDIACGSGRHCAALNNTKAEIIGIDLSERNICLAKSLENERIHFYQHDMRHVFCINYFDIVLNLFTSFGYFERDVENRKTARSISLNLKKSGLLILDYFNSSMCIENLKLSEFYKVGEIEFEIIRSHQNRSIVKDIIVKDHGAIFQFQERVKLYTLKELQELFSQFNLHLIAHYGDYELSEYNSSNSERLICIFQKI